MEQMESIQRIFCESNLLNINPEGNLASLEMIVLRRYLGYWEEQDFKGYFESYQGEINHGLSFEDDVTLFLRDKTKLICHIAGHLYHGHFDTALRFIFVYNDLYGDFTVLHAAFFSKSRGTANHYAFNEWLSMCFEDKNLSQFVKTYKTDFTEWKIDDNI